jgi:undecaprenyl-diphosphatase
VREFVVVIASYAAYLIPLAAAWAWWRSPRASKVPFAAVGALTIALAVLALALASLAWTDPRPFVVDGQTPLIPHAPDNGFPSDHTTLGAAIAAALLPWRRRLAGGLLLLAAGVGAARVAAHVHHVPDVVGGMLIGIACAALAILMVRAAQSLLAARIQRQTGPAPAMQPLSTHQPIRSRRAQDDHSPD